MNNKLKIFAVLTVLTVGFIGSASAQNYYNASTCSDLQSVDDVFANVVLENNIDCGGQSFSTLLNDGSSLYGQGYTISNFEVTNALLPGYDETFFKGALANVEFENFEASQGSAGGGILSTESNQAPYHDFRMEDAVIKGTGASLLGDPINGDFDRMTFENITFEASDNGGIAASGTNFNWNEAVFKDIDVKNSPFIGSTSGDGFNQTIVLNSSGNYLVRDFGGPVENFVVGGSAGGFDDLFQSTDIDGATDVYYDSNYYSTSQSFGTALTTSEMTGSSAETNMPGLDFTNTWVTTDSYPTFSFTLDPIISDLESPENNAVLDTGTTQNFNFSVNSRGSSTNVDLRVTYPNSTTITEYSDSISSGTTKDYSVPLSFSETGNYDWNVDLGNDVSATRDFEVINYQQPSTSLNSPVNENVVSYNSRKNMDFSFDVNSADISGDYTLQLKNGTESTYNDVATGNFNSGDNSLTETVSVSFPASGTQDKDWRLKLEDKFSSYTTTESTFTVERLEEPDIVVESPAEGETFYMEGGAVNTNTDIPVKGYVNNSEETGTAFFRSNGVDGVGGTDYVINLGSINEGDNTFTGNLTVGEEGTYTSSRLDAEYPGNTFSSQDISFDVEPGYPVINNFEVEPSGFNGLSVGQQINATLSGDITLDEVDRIVYSLSVQGINDPADVTVNNIDFQDQNSWTHTENNIYEIKEEYQGRDIALNVQVFDTEDRADNTFVQGTLGAPPDELITNSPENAQLFLIPEGDTETEVDIEWGVDTSAYSGTAELIVNGNTVGSFQIDSDSENIQTYTDSYTEGEYSWKVRFTDSQGDTYETSDQRYFKVTEEPIGLTLQNPAEGEEFNLLDRNSIEVDHSFEIDSRASPQNYYYRFTLTNEDTNTVLRNRTSSNFDTGIDEYTQTVSGLSNASYSWDVKVFGASDNTLLESAGRLYTIVKEPLFDLSIDSPIDGSVYQVEPGNTTDVTVRYAVETYAEATDFTLERNGTVVDTKSVSKGTSNTFTTTLNSLSPDTYSLTLSGEDSEGNANSTSVQFEVKAVEDEDSEEAVPKVYEAEFRPSIQDARVGDELNLYIEGTKFPEDVDFIDVKVETGAGTETFTVPGDQLNRQNSFNYTIEDALTVTSAMLGSPATIFGSVQSVAGQVSSFFFPQGEAGESTTIGAIPNYPTSDVSIKQPPGVSEDVRFDFNVNSLSQEVDYQVLVKDEGTPGYGLVGGSVGDSSLDPIPPNSNENVVMYRNLDDEIFVNESRGNFKWKVVVFTGDGSASDDSKEYSRTADFNIVDSNTTTLNFLNPSNNAELETPEGSSLRDVSFDFNVDTGESGRLYLELYDDTVGAEPDIVYDEQVESGRTPDSEVETLERGSYRAVLNFENENVDLNRTRDFSIVRPSESTQCENPTVALKKPTYDILYADSSYVFEWAVCNPNNYDEPSNTTLYIEDDEGNVQESFEEEYDTQGEVLSFSPRVRTDFPQGEYSTYANYSYPDTTIQSDVKDFQIVDFTKPESFDLSPDGRSFKAGEEIPVSWTTQAYEENVEASAKIKRVGEYQSNTVKVADISSNSEQDFSDTITREAGEYEFFVDMEVSPEGSASPMTFQSNRTTFEVTSVNLSDADFTLIEPEQGAEYDVPNSSENASVPFAFDVGVTGEKDWKIDLLVQDVGEETGFVREERFTLPGTAGTGSFNTSVDLNESGYRYRIRAIDPNSEESLSEIRSFVVDDPQTEEIPEVPNPDPDEGTFENAVNFISAVIGGFASIVGTAGLFLVATLLTVASGTVLHLLTDSNGISLLSMLTTVVFFVGIGWYPGWVGMILFLGSAAIFMIGVRKVTTGGGD